MVYDTDISRYMLYGTSWKGLAYTDAGGGGGSSYSPDSMGLRYTGTTTRNFVSIGAGNVKGYAAGTAVNGRNIAVGDSALRLISTGIRNVAIGWNAQSNLTSGAENTSIGYNANRDLTGSRNTSLGYQAGVSIGAINDNTSIGHNSNAAGAGGTGSTSIGAGSNYYGTNYSAVVGAGALNSTSGGNYSAALGYSALYGASGTGNSAIGAQAGYTLSGANNVLLGAYATAPSTSSNNQFTLWHGATMGAGGGYNTLTRFTGGQWLFNNTSSAVTSATTSAALEINGTTAGFLPPRLTATQRNAIATPAAGLMVYDTDSSRYMLYGSSWKGLAYTDAGGGGGGSTTSASGTGISLVNGSSLVKRLKAGFNTIVTDNTDSVTISRDTLTQTLTDGATVTYDATAGVSARVTLGGNRTLSITNMNNGMYLTLVVIQDGTGGRTLTLPSGVKVVNGGAGAVTLSSAANARDILTFFEIGDVIYCNVGRNYN